MAIAHVYRHLVVKNGNFILLLTCSVQNGNFTLLVTSSGQEWHFCHEIDMKTCIFWSKPRHVTPQIDRLGKAVPVMRVSTHIYGFLRR